MTNDLGTNIHKRPSSADIDIAILKERHHESVKRDEQLFGILYDIQSQQQEMKTMLEVGNRRFLEIERRQIVGEVRIDTIEADKRSLLAMVASGLAAVGAGATAWFK